MTKKTLAASFHRGWILIKYGARTKSEIIGLISSPALFLFIASQRSGVVAGTQIKLSLLMTTGAIALSAAVEGLISTPGLISLERMDGTLLRLRSTPNGMPAYIISRIVHVAVRALLSALVMLIGGALIFDMPLPDTFGKWVTLVWVLLLGIAATVPVGTVIGSLMSNPRIMAFIQFPIMAVVMLSGVFTPITALPKPVQYLLEIFPMKWMAQGVRSAMLPDQMLVAETGQSWQHAWTALVLVLWAVFGLAVGPRMLLRVARKESGSTVSGRRNAAMAGGL